MILAGKWIFLAMLAGAQGTAFGMTSTIRIEIAPGEKARLDATQWRYQHSSEAHLDELWVFENREDRKIRVRLDRAAITLADGKGTLTRGPAGAELALSDVCEGLHKKAKRPGLTEIKLEYHDGDVPFCTVMRRTGYATTEQVAFLRGSSVYYLSWQTILPKYASQRGKVAMLAKALTGL